MFHVSVCSDNSTFTPLFSLFSSLCTTLAINYMLGNIATKRLFLFYALFLSKLS